MPRAPKTPAATSTALAPAKKTGGNIVDIKAQLQAQVAALAERTAPAQGAAVRVTQDKKFKFPDGTEGPGPFQAVVVDFITIRKYYPGVYDPNNIQPPACFAISTNPKGMMPSPNSPELQSPEGCDKCPQNQWGSANVGQGKACKESRKLALAGAADDGEDPKTSPLWTLELSPTAIRPFDGYVNSVAKTFGVPPVGVVSQIGFDPSESFATVRLSNPEPNPAIGEHFARQGEAQEMLSVEPDVSSYGQEAPAPAARGRVAAKRPAARR